MSFTINGVIVPDIDGFGHGEATPFQEALFTGNTASEAGFGSLDLAALYDTIWSCDDAAGTSGTGASLAGLDLTYGDRVTCTFTNQRKPLIRFTKDFVPADDPNRVYFTLNGPIVSDGDGVANGETTDWVVAQLADNLITENPFGGYDLPGGYATAWACNDAANSSGTGTTISDLDLAYGDMVSCTFTNSRFPTLQVYKQVVGGDGGHNFDLDIDGTTYAENALNGGHTDRITLTPGLHTVSETFGIDTPVSGFDVTVTGDCASDGTINLVYGQDATCTIVNSRHPTLQVYKQVVGGDGGHNFDLDIDGTTYAENALDGGHTDRITLTPGLHTVSETFGIDTPVSGFDVTVIGDCASDGTINLVYGQDATCTIVNSRIPRLRLQKAFLPADDPGRVSFTINGALVPDIDGFGHGEATPFEEAYLTDNTASEAGFGGFDLGHYDTTWWCDDAAGTSGTGTSLASLDLAYGDEVTCTFLNSRKPELRLAKAFVPADDPNRVSFTINGVIVPDIDGFGHGEATPFQEALFTGNTASEAGFGSLDLAALYDTIWSCDDAAGTSGTGASLAGLDLAYGDRVTCTFTNQRKPVIRFTKDFVPADDPNRVYFTLNGPIVSDGDGVANGETTDWVVAQLADNLITENPFGGYDLPGGYATAWACNDAANSSGTGTTIAISTSPTATWSAARSPTRGDPP